MENNNCRVPIEMAAIEWPLVIPIFASDFRFFSFSRQPIAESRIRRLTVISRKMIGCSQIPQIFNERKMRASAVKFLGRCNGWNGRMGEMKNHNARKKFLD